jgi:hypothetical protein
MIRDVRVFPSPPEMKVISEPGEFTAWSLTIQHDASPYFMVIHKADTRHVVARHLRELADRLEAADA